MVLFTIYPTVRETCTHARSTCKVSLFSLSMCVLVRMWVDARVSCYVNLVSSLSLVLGLNDVVARFTDLILAEFIFLTLFFSHLFSCIVDFAATRRLIPLDDWA